MQSIRRSVRAAQQKNCCPAQYGLRELIISRRRTGYLARYEFDISRDLVRVARIRHQRESGYSEGEV